MHLIRVTDNELAKEFIQLPIRLKHQGKLWSRTQQKHLLSLIKRKSDFFEQGGEAEFWILTNFRGETIGRVAAFLLPGEGDLRGYVGLFDCINHAKAATLLFDECKTWMQKHSVHTMEGPFSTLPFQIAGISLENILHQSAPFVTVQSSYFGELFKIYGFQNIETLSLLSFKGEVKIFLNTNLSVVVDGYDIIKVDKSNIGKATEAISSIYHHPDHQGIMISKESISQWLNLVFKQQTSPLIWIAYHNQTAVAYAINVFVDTPIAEELNEQTTLWKQLTTRFTPKNKSLLNLDLKVLEGHEFLALSSAMINLANQAVQADPANQCDHFYILEEQVKPFESDLAEHETVDKFVKFAYKFDQEPLIDTFAKSNLISPE